MTILSFSLVDRLLRIDPEMRPVLRSDFVWLPRHQRRVRATARTSLPADVIDDASFAKRHFPHFSGKRSTMLSGALIAWTFFNDRNEQDYSHRRFSLFGGQSYAANPVVSGNGRIAPR